jgi:hypothetical protein
MKNPLREMSRPKALGLAGAVAGAVAISGAAAALNIGLLTGGGTSRFDPQKVVATADGTIPTTTTSEPPVEIVYEDVYDRAPAATATSDPTVPAPGSVSDDSDDRSSDDSAEEPDEVEADDTEADEVESDDTEADEVESEDDHAEVEDHAEEPDDEFDD